MEDQDIQTLVTRLARRHPSGGTVVERAAILAEGADFTEVVAWITAHDGEPEAAPVTRARGGLHGSRLSDTSGEAPRNAPRFVLPPGALD
jgi:hypothetical protein